MNDSNSSFDLKYLALALGVLGIVLVGTTIRGAFIIDEINYMVNAIALREGRLTVVGTEGISPSKELFYFDPEPSDRLAISTPVVSIAPPLYGPIAVPFVLFGWRGLAMINTLSFLLSALLIFLFVKRLAKERAIPWLAVALFVLGGYSIEYAQGVWPHMLSVFLCTAAAYFVSYAWEDVNTRNSVIGGCLMGIACGIREQNVFLTACLGLTLLGWGHKRLYSTAMYMAGTAIPLLASATINYFKFGVWFPTPKAAAYASFVSSPITSHSWLQPLKVFWVKVVDFSAFSVFRDPTQFVDYSREPSSGAFLVAGIVKKALIQSSPWIALAIVLSAVVWVNRSGQNGALTRALRALSILILLPLAAFAMAGFRMDGLAFNQRYLLEVVPFAAIVIALSLEGVSFTSLNVVHGFLAAGLLFAGALLTGSREVLHIAILKVPLLFAVGLMIAWFYAHRPFIKPVLSITLGLCLGWSFFVQTIDVLKSREIRSRNAVSLDSLSAAIPNHSALFTYWGADKSAAGPMQLDKDVVILDVLADMGKDAPHLAQEFVRMKRRVFIVGSGMPPGILRTTANHDSLAVAMSSPFLLYQILDSMPGSDSTTTNENIQLQPTESIKNN